MTEQTQQTPSSLSTALGLQVTLKPARACRHVDTIVLRQGLYAVGAAVDADVVLPVGGVQRQHCRIEIADDGVTLTADSRMTWVNDQPVDSRDLCDGDRLAIGPLEFTVEIRNLSSGPGTETDTRPLQAEELEHLFSSTTGTKDEAVTDSGSVDTDAHAVTAQVAEARQMLARHEAKLA